MLKNILAIGLLAVLVPSVAHTTGKMTCDTNPDEWQSQDALKAKLESEGWQVRKSKVDGGCYEVYGTTPDDQRVEAYFDPVTLETLLIDRRGEVLYRKDSD